MMIEKESTVAKEILAAQLSIPEKLVSVVNAFRPDKEETVITDVLERKENIMHDKICKKIVEVAVPILAEIVKEGIAQGIFECNYIEERVKMLLVISQHMFDYGNFSDKDLEVYIDMLEKLLGAKNGKIHFISKVLVEGAKE
ncbi:Uncharacterised protein [[Eubacterium] infirmum]|nr:Uncharacterised protein [[Eubacterium] infirmum]